MLHIDNINAFYGRIQALWGVSLSVNEGEIVAVVGANGAGKSTLLNTVVGLLKPASGMMSFLDQNITHLAPHERGELGIAYVPEGGRPFTEMSVQENLEMGAYVRQAWRSKGKTLGQIYDLFPRLEERKDQLARTLSGGERQMLAIGRALMSRPRICLFDEPSIGLAPVLVAEFFRIIQMLRDQGITILLIEQNIRQSLEIADRGYVLESGRIVLAGSSAELLQEELIKIAYLGL
jgi:branched-chain amino acid transport system ATP-binding protein